MGGKAFAGRRLPLAEAEQLGNVFLKQIVSSGSGVGYLAGSVRRRKSEVGDIDIVVIPFNDEKLSALLVSMFGRQCNGQPGRRGLVEGVQFDIMLSGHDFLGATMMHCTGSVETNISQRARAKRTGYLLNEKGLWKGAERFSCSHDEHGIYAALGLRWLEPEER